jgi:lysophospholipase L1-like esterase
LPLGDSITDGIGTGATGGGYRVELFKQATEAGQNITFLGASANGPTTVAGKPFPRNHEGHSGWTIQQINNIVPTPALNGDPHIILLHIGTNDMVSSASGADGRLEALIDEILDDNPSALLAVSSIIPLNFGGGSAAVNAFNQKIPGIVRERADAGFNIIFVDQFAGFPTSELPDSVHPNQVGYERMGRKWYDAIKSYLN